MKKLLTTLLVSLSTLFFAQAQTITFTVVTPPCHSDGVIVATVSGLTPPLNFTYSTGLYTSTTISHFFVHSTSDTLTGWVGGSLTAYVTDTPYTGYAYNNYSGGPFSMMFTPVDALCPALGTITATISGGTSPYTYQWYNSSGGLGSTTNPMSGAPDTYYLIATDARGCSMDSRTISDSDLTLNYISPFYGNVTTTTAACTNGSATVTSLSGGTAPYSYLWSNGATSTSITGLVSGYYGITVTDHAGCSWDSSYVYVDQSPAISVYTTTTPATCLDTDGAITAFASGGVSPYNYLWNTGATTASLSGLSSNYYSVTATDARGCIGIGRNYVSIYSPITVTYTSTPSSCIIPTGTATLTVSGGTSPYTIVWYTTPPQSGYTASSLTYGYYSFQVTDALGCVQTGTVYVPPVDVMSAYYSVTDARCTSATGGITIYPSGGVLPYTYSWSTGGTSSTVSSLSAGIYEVTVTDHNGCSIVKYPIVNIVSPVTIGFGTTPSSCLFTADGSITAVPAGGTAPYTYAWNTGGTTATIGSLLKGYYWVSVTDAAGCTAWDSLYLGYNDTADFCYCTIQGTVYNDVNGNCVQDAGEPGINNIQLHCSGMGYTYTDSTGYYSFKVPTGSYTVSQNILAYYPLSTCQSNNIAVSATAASGCTHTVNFADTLNPIHDIHQSIWDYTFAVPGNTYTQTTIVTNDGTVSEPAILAGYKADGQLFGASFVPADYSSGGSYWYTTPGTFPALAPGRGQQFFVNYTVPTDIPTGTTVVFKDTIAYASPMSNWLTDYSPWNNVNYFTTVTVASHDPNFKEVSPKGYSSAGIITYADSVLEYMVHFQNTGTWFAQNIVVVDTLDPNLDWSTLRPVFMSAKCKVSVTETGVATFTFNNINLPAASYNDIRSNGMFTYTVHTRRGLSVGTQFKNRAAIYFDYNSPVITNTTVNTLGFPESVPVVTAPDASSFTIYPNPANNTFNVVLLSDINADYTLKVTDITGKTQLVKNINLQKGTQTITVDAARLSAGVYFVSVTGNDKVQTQKLVIIK